MLRIAPLSCQDQRTLRQWQDQATPRLARAGAVDSLGSTALVSPRSGLRLHCCRRTVRRWFHTELDQGLAGLQGQPLGRQPTPAPTVIPP